MDFSLIAQMVVSGAFMGLVYALIAYGFQLTYATSKSINFGQGELVMVSAFFSLTLTDWGLPYWLMVPGGLLFGAAMGLVVERAAVRLALEQKSEGWILLSIILGLLFFSTAENIWGRDDRGCLQVPRRGHHAPGSFRRRRRPQHHGAHRVVQAQDPARQGL
jgi:branched-chain amino acid transport system permease protein